MEPRGGLAKGAIGRRSASLPSTESELLAPRLDNVLLATNRGCTWPLERTRSHKVAAMSDDHARKELPVNSVSRSTLHRLLATPDSAPSSPLRSPRRRCSAASAAMVTMVHSPRAFATSNCLTVEKRDPTAQTMPNQCLAPMFSGLGAYASTSNGTSRCNSPNPLGRFPDGPIPSDEEDDVENEDRVTLLRKQVALLVKSLEDEKKRRASEQQLMQTKIIELQTLIRHNGNEVVGNHSDGAATASVREKAALRRENDWQDNVQSRRWSAPLKGTEWISSDASSFQTPVDLDGNNDAKEQLARLRAQMHAIVLDAQHETQALRTQLEGAKQSYSRREKHLTLESTFKVSALEQKHAVVTTRLAQQAADCAARVVKLQTTNHDLLTQLQVQQERLKQLECSR